MTAKRRYDTREPPFETADLRRNLKTFLNRPFGARKIGDYKWGVYAFYDYDREPIYVGQTNELVRTRIRRHLTNQRTDAVAMSVLDPLEVFEIEVWPLPEYQGVERNDSKAAATLNALEYAVFERAIRQSKFKAILNEKDPAAPKTPVKIPPSERGLIVSESVLEIRSHPDFRIARRAQTLARLAQVISERQVKSGLRRALLTQAKRLEWLAQQRFDAASDPDEDEAEGD